MPTRVFLDGIVVAPADARISVFDRGFLYGDSIVEVMRTQRGRPVDLGAHLDRLERGAQLVRMRPPPRPVLVQALDATLTAAAEPEARIRLMLTRGPGDMRVPLAELGPPCPVIIVEPLTLPPRELYERGLAVQILGAMPSAVASVPGVKPGSNLGAVLAVAAARDLGADEAIRLDPSGRVVEGATSNVFAVIGGRVLTPPVDLGLLPGVTRGRVLALCASDGLAAAEAAFSVDELRAAGEAFVTSSIRGVVPIAAIDGAPRPVGSSTRRVLALYQRYLDSL
jgi:branched-chain amino acid aminotransferase